MRPDPAVVWRRARQIMRDPDAVDVRTWPLEQAIAFSAALDRLDYYEAAWVEAHWR